MGDSYVGTRYVLIVRLPREIQVRIEDIFLGLAGATKPTMGYHITLLGPFCLQEGVDYRSLDSVQQVCGRWQPFEAHIASVSCFESRNDNAVYLRVVECNDIVELHYELLEASRGVAAMQNERTRAWNETKYEPHVTVALNLTDKELPSFMRAVLSTNLQATFRVSAVWLCRQEPNGPWQYVAEFPLGTPEEEVIEPEEV